MNRKVARVALAGGLALGGATLAACEVTGETQPEQCTSWHWNNGQRTIVVAQGPSCKGTSHRARVICQLGTPGSYAAFVGAWVGDGGTSVAQCPSPWIGFHKQYDWRG